MTSLELIKLLKEELSDELTGTVYHDGDAIKWEYDGINEIHYADFNDHLEVIAIDDRNIMEEFLEDRDLDQFILSNIEISDTFVYFYIEE